MSGYLKTQVWHDCQNLFANCFSLIVWIWWSVLHCPKFPSNWSSGHAECSFDKAVEIFPSRRCKHLTKFPKTITTFDFFQKIVFLFSKLQMARENQSNSGQSETDIFNKFVLLQVFLWTLRKRVWLDRQKSLAISLSLIVWVWWRVLNCPYFSSKSSSGHAECSFDNPAEIFPSESWKLWTEIPKTIKRFVFFSKDNISV